MVKKQIVHANTLVSCYSILHFREITPITAFHLPNWLKSRMRQQSQHSSDCLCQLPLLRVFGEYVSERYRSETSPSQLLLLSNNTSRCSPRAATDVYQMSMHLANASSAKRLLPELLPEQLATCFHRACCTFALPFDLRRLLELKRSSRSSDIKVARQIQKATTDRRCN